MLYDQFFIDDLKSRADLVRLIEPYAPLKKKGANWMGCCPFHQEKTPSFSVNPAKGFYKCFGCGKGGNAFTFLMEMEGLNFPEAIQRVAEASGVPLPEPIDDRQYEQNKKRKEEKKQLSDQVIELNKIALEFWESELLGEGGKGKKSKSEKDRKAAKDYLEQRGITDEIIKQFRIGYSPDSWDSLLNHLKEKGADEKLIEQSGLVSVNEEKDRVFDRFRGRIMFPVLDVNGNPVAFGARAMGDDQPKYLNSPETPAYVKGQHLYGLFQSKDAIRQKKFAILVEGYLDLIALYQFGITNVAASLGTAFTPEQSKVLRRFTKSIVVNYDDDTPGRNAAQKAIKELLNSRFEIKVLVLPGGQDPDDYIRANGADAYSELRGRAKPFNEYIFQNSVRYRDLSMPIQRMQVVEELLPYVVAVPVDNERRIFFDEVMRECRVTDQLVQKELWSKVRDGLPAESEKFRKFLKSRLGPKITVAEQHLLELLTHDRELLEAVLPVLEESDYETLATAPIFRALFTIRDKKADLNLDSLLHHADDEELAADFIPLLMMGESKRAEGEVIDNVLHEAENCVLSLRSMAIQTRLHDVSQELLAAEQAGDQPRVDHLVVEHLELSKMRRSLLSKIRET